MIGDIGGDGGSRRRQWWAGRFRLLLQLKKQRSAGDEKNVPKKERKKERKKWRDSHR
jgi:hypothetical protein